MYENKRQKVAPREIFFRRLRYNAGLACTVLLGSLAIGVAGYKLTVPEFDLYDSLLNASMILSGMGPVIAPDIILTRTAKVFASVYALFSGITFLSTFGILIAPILHRFFHKLHMTETDD
jgi:hypothetical protein